MSALGAVCLRMDMCSRPLRLESSGVLYFYAMLISVEIQIIPASGEVRGGTDAGG
jgi:hypothetical protein